MRMPGQIYSFLVGLGNYQKIRLAGFDRGICVVMLHRCVSVCAGFALIRLVGK